MIMVDVKQTMDPRDTCEQFPYGGVTFETFEIFWNDPVNQSGMEHRETFHKTRTMQVVTTIRDNEASNAKRTFMKVGAAMMDTQEAGNS